MAYIGLKQLDPTLTGSLQVSGSSGVTGSLDVDTNIVAGNRVTSDYGTINYSLTVNEAGHGGGDFRVEGTSDPYLIFADAGTDKLAIGTNVVSPSLLTVDGDITATHITASGNISASGTIYADNFTSTGGDSTGISFTDDFVLTGNMTASGAISASGNIRSKRFEIKGADNYIDRAWDGSLFLVSAADVAVQPGGGELTVDGNVVPDTDSTDDLGSTSKYWRNAYIDSVITTGNVSGSSTSIGSFGSIYAATHITASGNISASGDISADDVYIGSDANTIGHVYLNNYNTTFMQMKRHSGDDKIIMKAGGQSMIAMVKDNGGDPSQIVFNDDGVDVDIRFEGISDNSLLYLDGSQNSIQLGSAATSHVTASGNINTTDGRIYEAGTSVIDHATAMAIVFGG